MEDKRARKKAVKEARRARREQKKQTSAMFRGEQERTKKQQAGTGTQASVLRL